MTLFRQNTSRRIIVDLDKLPPIKRKEMKKHYQTSRLFLCLLSLTLISKSIAQNYFSEDYLVVRLNHKFLDFEKIDNPSFNNFNLISYLNEQGKVELEK